MGEPAVNKKRYPLAAGLLSFILPGLGQIYNGQLKKGILFYSLFLVVPSIMLLSGIHYKFSGLIIFFALVLGFYIFVIAEAVYRASKITDYQLQPCNRLYVYLLALLLSFIVNTAIRGNFGFETYMIPNISMSPTLHPGDLILVDTGYYMMNEIKRNDVIVFKYPRSPDLKYIKRVVAIEGDEIESRDKVIYLNGEKLDEPFVVYEDDSIITEGPRDNFGPKNFGYNKVPENNLFVLGDNRDMSQDSRYYGFVETSLVKGKALYIYWSKNKSRIGKEIR